jgi:hypothetical protein
VEDESCSPGEVVGLEPTPVQGFRRVIGRALKLSADRGVDAAARARYGEVGTIEPLFSWCCISIDDWPRLAAGLFLCARARNVLPPPVAEATPPDVTSRCRSRPQTSPGPGSSSGYRGPEAFKMFWSELIRYVALAGQIAFAAGIAAMITMLLKYAIG